MSDEILLPRRVTVLGEAMRPLWVKLEAEIDMPTYQTSALSDSADIVSHHIDKLRNIVPRLTNRVNDLMTDVVSNEEASDAEVYRAVGRFEACLDDLLVGYHDVRTLNACGADIKVRDLLTGVYQHSLTEIRDWMEELVETIADPMSAVKRRGLPTSGYVELPLMLTLTAAPQLASLLRWAERESGLPQTPAGKSGLGFWGTVCAVALGWGIGESFFGGND